MTDSENTMGSDGGAQSRLLPILAWIVGGTAVLIGVALGVAVLGTTFGIWGFRTPLSTIGLLLRWQGGILSNIVFYLGWVAFCGGILLFVVALVQKHTGLRLAAGVAILGGIFMYPAYTIPLDFATTARSAPPIHDVTTDTADPPQFVAVLPLREGSPNRADYGAVPSRGTDPARFDESGFNPELLGELIRGAFPDLKTTHIDGSAAETFAQALAAAQSMGWEIVDTNEAEGRIEATDTTPWLRFKDDVVIRVAYHEGGAMIDVRSVSRLGGSDVGKNAARIREYLATL